MTATNITRVFTCDFDGGLEFAAALTATAVTMAIADGRITKEAGLSLMDAIAPLEEGFEKFLEDRNPPADMPIVMKVSVDPETYEVVFGFKTLDEVAFGFNAEQTGDLD